MENTSSRAEINMAKIPVSGDLPGLIFTVGTVMIFAWGVPALRYWLPAAIVLGGGIALFLHFIRHESQPASWILSGTKK